MASLPQAPPNISSTDAIGPAFSRAMATLSRPFALGKFLKQTLIAALAEISFLNAMIGIPIQIIQIAIMSKAFQNSHASDATRGFNPEALMMTISGVIGFFGIALLTLFLYFICRLRFVVLDLVLYQQGQIRPAWRKFGSASWRYFGLTLLLAVGVLVIAAAIAGPFAPGILHTMKGLGQAGPQAAGKMMALFLPYWGVIFALGLLAQVIDGVVRDLFLPTMGLQNAPIEACWKRFVTLVQNETGEFVLFVLLRSVLGYAVQMGAMVVILIPVGVLAGTGILAGALLYHPLWSSPGGKAIFILYCIVAAIIIIALYLLLIGIALGVGGIFKQSYAILWLSTRYPEIAAVLYPPQVSFIPETPVTPPPPAVSGEPVLPPVPPPDITGSEN